MNKITSADIKPTRKALDWTQLEMATALEITPQHVSLMERGQEPKKLHMSTANALRKLMEGVK